MSRNKILIVLAFIIAMLVAFAGCGNNNDPDNNGYEVIEGIQDTTLVIYTTLAPDLTAPIIAMFEERYGVFVELYHDSTAQTLARLHAEATHPQADVMWGGDIFSVTPHLELFEEFVSVNEPYMLPGHAHTSGVVTSFATNAGILIVNTSQLSGMEIRGYECLLNPALRGRIAIAYPSAASSSFNHLVNQVFAMGGGDTSAGWDYIEQFISNVSGNILPSSAAVHAGVASGDFIVGLTCEDAFLPLDAGADVEVVHMYEGIVAMPAVVGIVNGAINREGAEAFIDFVTSYEIQVFVAASLGLRAVRSDVQSNVGLNWLVADVAYVLQNRDSWIERFWDLWMLHN